jgi:uncharacterized protein with HEPN domain
MKPKERDYVLYLEDMLLSMIRIQEYTSNLTFQDFKWDYKTVDAVLRNFEVIGEASKNVPKKLKTKYPELPWEEMYQLRNRVSHEYFGIDYEIIWDIVRTYLPKNQEEVARIIMLEGK